MSLNSSKALSLAYVNIPCPVPDDFRYIGSKKQKRFLPHFCSLQMSPLVTVSINLFFMGLILMLDWIRELE